MARLTHAFVAAFAVLPACTGVAARSDAPAARFPPGPFERVARLEGFELPESVLHDPRSDTYLVSCMGAHPTAADNDGWIARIDAANPDQVERFLIGGEGGVRLDGPKGMALAGDLLWVADVTHLRAFDRASGAPRAQLDLSTSGAVALNDVSAAPDGTLWVSDPRLLFDDAGTSSHHPPERVYRVDPEGTVEVILEGPALGGPNGIEWDAANDVLWIAPLDAAALLAWSPGEPGPRARASTPPHLDGLELTRDWIVISALREGTVRALPRTGGRVVGAGTVWVEGLALPGNLGLDRRRGRLLVPLIGDGQVEIWAPQT